MTRWANEGVLLLNTALTVAQNDARSHMRNWKGFTELVLRAIVEEREHVVFLLWGNQAIERALMAGVTEPPHRLIESAQGRPPLLERQSVPGPPRHPEVRWRLRDEA